MSVFKTAYDTQACHGFQIKKTIDAIKVALNDGQLAAVKGTDVYTVEGGAAMVDNIPGFAHPLLVQRYDREVVVVDVRDFGRFNTEQQTFTVRNNVEYKIALQRAHLNDIWIRQSPSILQNLSPLPLALYASWISENVAKRFALDPNEQYKLSIYAAIFYMSQFVADQGDWAEQDKSRLASIISRAMKVSANDVMKVFDENTSISPDAHDGCPHIASVYHFCNIVSGLSVRLKEFNPGLLFSILGGTWFGANARETLAVALEHPPTWIAILVAAFYERTFKNSGITKMAERRSHRNDGDIYVRAVMSLLDHNIR